MRILLLALGVTLVSPSAFPQHPCQIVYNEVNNNHLMSSSMLGLGLDLEGGWIAAGAPGTGTNQIDDFGAVHMYAATQDGWQLSQIIRPLVPVEQEFFGVDLDLDGDALLVGSWGRAFLYRRNGDFWVFEHEFQSDQAPSPSFGRAVSLDGDLAVVGAWGEEDGLGQNPGAAYVYRRTAGVWSLEARLVPPAGEWMGASVEIQDDILVAGAPMDDFAQADSGSVTVFELGPGGWDAGVRFSGSNIGAEEQFGNRVELVGDELVVAAYHYNGGNAAILTEGSGLLYRFQKSGPHWTEVGVVLPPAAPFSYSTFGEDLASHGNRMIVGTSGSGAFDGGAFVYEMVNGNWEEVAAVTWPINWIFGIATAIEGDSFLVTALWLPGPLGSRGGFYVYDLSQGDISSYCTATPNSTGSPAELSAEGVVGISQNDLSLHATPVPDQPGLIYYGSQPASVPFGDGVRCVGGPPVFRGAPVQASGGEFVFELDFTKPPAAGGQVLPGSTWYYQAWFRDPAANGTGFNLSTALAIEFCP